MGGSLFDQLKKSGLVDEKKAKQAKKEKYQQTKQPKQKKGAQARPLDESKLRVQQAQVEKVARDRELNLQQKQAAEKKAIAAQIKQMIEMNSIEVIDGNVGFNFTDGANVQRFYVDEEQQGLLVRGRLAIVKMKDAYHLLPSGAAEKIRLRDPGCIMVCNTTVTQASDADDQYADYQVPDDLMW